MSAVGRIQEQGVKCDHSMVSRWARGERKPLTAARFAIRRLWHVDPLKWDVPAVAP